MDVGAAVRRLGPQGLRVQALGAVALVVNQTGHQLGRRRFQQSGSELVQQAADLVGAIDEQRGLDGIALLQGLRARQGMFEQPR